MDLKLPDVLQRLEQAQASAQKWNDHYDNTTIQLAGKVQQLIETREQLQYAKDQLRVERQWRKEHLNKMKANTGNMKPNEGLRIKTRKVPIKPVKFEQVNEFQPVEQFAHTASSKKPKLELIPYPALVALAERFELGQANYGSKAWNALSSQVGLEDKEWLKGRISHVIHHAYLYLQKLEGIIPDDGDDDAAAIMWGGACLFEAKRLKDKK